jgi:transcriptional regulator with XRE-family HTH domain
MTSVKQQLRRNLRRDAAYRRAFVCEHVDQNIPFQIRANREHRGWTQADLGKKAKMAQARISLLEDPNYSRFTISTLKRLAAAFDTGLHIAFVPVSAVLDRSVNLANHLVSPSADEDSGLDDETESTTAEVAGSIPLSFESRVPSLTATSLQMMSAPGRQRQPGPGGSAIAQLYPRSFGGSSPAWLAQITDSQTLGTAKCALVP